MNVTGCIAFSSFPFNLMIDNQMFETSDFGETEVGVLLDATLSMEDPSK